MNGLDWLLGKLITGVRVARAGMHLEMVFTVYGHLHEFVIELRHPDTMDWFDTTGMTIEETVGKTVLRVEVDERVVPGSSSDIDYTYYLHFTDLSCIQIFADARQTLSDGRQYQIRDKLFFSVRNPHEEPWDPEDRSVLDELDAELEATRRRHLEAEEGQLLPQEQVKYVTHF